jgi:hypothetical protein
VCFLGRLLRGFDSGLLRRKCGFSLLRKFSSCRLRIPMYGNRFWLRLAADFWLGLQVRFWLGQRFLGFCGRVNCVLLLLLDWLWLWGTFGLMCRRRFRHRLGYRLSSGLSYRLRSRSLLARNRQGAFRTDVPEGLRNGER